ncbi:MAG: hypothetical protein O7D86_12460 [Proteobacteria bacterium]|nr:hypothetical protein [Pseudomonadota bacterium]
MLESAADVRNENLTKIVFGAIKAKPPKITEYANSRLVKTNKRSPHNTTKVASIINILLAVKRSFIISSVPANHLTPQKSLAILKAKINSTSEISMFFILIDEGEQV